MTLRRLLAASDRAGLGRITWRFDGANVYCFTELAPLGSVVRGSDGRDALERLLRRLRGAQDRIGEHRDTLLAEHWVRENERALGRPLVGRLVAGIGIREQRLRRQSAARAAKVLEAWQAWRDATGRVRRGASRDRP